MKEPERVDESAVDEAADPLALLGQKPADGRIAHRIVNIDRPVTDIEVAAKNQFRAGLEQARHVVREIVEPAHLECLPLVARRARRMIDADHRQVAVVGSQKAALAVVALDPHARHDAVGLAEGQNRHPAVTFPNGRKVVAAVTHALESFRRNLLGLGFGSCRQSTSGRSSAIQSQSPLPIALRIPLTLLRDDLHRISVIINKQ